MPLSRFAAMEAVLHLLTLHAPKAGPTKDYLLFTQYQLIGTTGCTAMEHTLQRSCHMLGYYRSQKYRQDDLRDFGSSGMMRFELFPLKKSRELCLFSRQRVYTLIRMRSGRKSGSVLGQSVLRIWMLLLMQEPEHTSTDIQISKAEKWRAFLLHLRRTMILRLGWLFRKKAAGHPFPSLSMHCWLPQN